MRCLLIACAAVAVLCGSAHADGTIGLYRDLDMSSCALSDASPGIVTVFVVQTGASAGASEFQLMPRDGASVVYLAESIPPGSAGNMGRADTGVAVSYGGCMSPPIHVLTVFYEGFGLSATCGEIAMLNDPRSRYVNPGHVAYVTCGGPGEAQIQWAEAGNAVVNADASCACGTDPGGGQTPVETATWGKVKALYVED